MVKVIWAPAALKDIESIAQFIERDSADRASLFVVRVIELVDQLSDFPTLGRIIPEIKRNECRELIYGVYRVMYIIKKNEVWITGVVHGARDYK